MKGLHYQLKSVLHDKFCLMTFLLPIVVAAVLHFAGRVDLSSMGDLSFGILEGGLPEQAAAWLEQYGSVTVYTLPDELTEAVNEPSTNMIGVAASGKGIKTMVSGDELDRYRRAADILPTLYGQRDTASQIKCQVLESPGMAAGLWDMFIAVTLVVAMFMGCTFNAMNIISEKEDGVAFINKILPMSHGWYMLQKLFVGFICGCLSSMITACICFRLSLQKAAFMLVLIALSAFVAALMGLLVGVVSEGLMAGMIYIKIIMILFMAVPILSFLVGSGGPVFSIACYLIPSQATFEGIMELSAGSTAKTGRDVFILLTHGVVWFLACLSYFKKKRKC